MLSGGGQANKADKLPQEQTEQAILSIRRNRNFNY